MDGPGFSTTLHLRRATKQFDSDLKKLSNPSHAGLSESSEEALSSLDSTAAIQEDDTVKIHALKLRQKQYFGRGVHQVFEALPDRTTVQTF